MEFKTNKSTRFKGFKENYLKLSYYFCNFNMDIRNDGNFTNINYMLKIKVHYILTKYSTIKKFIFI